MENEIPEKILSAISYSGQFTNGIWYTLISGGDTAGNEASCIINGIQYAKNGRGLNFVVYDSYSHKVVDSAHFDTSISNVREGDSTVELKEALAEGKSYVELSDRLKKLYLYNYRCERLKNAAKVKTVLGRGDFWKYFSEYWKSENTVVFLSVEGDVSGMLNSAVRHSLREIGLYKLAELECNDSYLAVIEEGKIIFEEKCHKRTSIETSGIGYMMSSGGVKNNNVSSILIHGEEHSSGGQGMNVVVFDKKLDMVIDSEVFE